MEGRMDMMGMARALTAHAGARQQLLARNVANADTPGFRAQDLGAFAQMIESGFSPMAPMSATRAGHLTGASWDGAARVRDAGGEASPNGNTVSIEGEMLRQAEIRREHDLAVSVYQSSLRLTRSAIGRG